jgi:hypothetical protein
VRVLAWICGFVPIFNRLRLVEIIWALGREPGDAAAVLKLTAAGKGIEAGRARAEKMFAEYPYGQIVATMGWLEVQHTQDLLAARQWLENAGQVDCKDAHLLLGLELFLSEHLEEYDTQQVVERILSRNDLPMQTTRNALLVHGRGLLKQRRWSEAQVVADRILSVEENPQARWIRWVKATTDGDDDYARTQLSIAQGKMSVAALGGFVALGWFYMGDKERAKQVLREAGADGAGFAIVNKDLARFVRDNFHATQISEAD